jgi:hypothetical protein
MKGQTALKQRRNGARLRVSNHRRPETPAKVLQAAQAASARREPSEEELRELSRQMVTSLLPWGW